MKTFLTLITILLLISLACNWIQLKSAQEQENWRTQDLERFQKEQSRKLGQISKRDSLISSLLNERKLDSATHAKNQGALKSKIAALKSKIGLPMIYVGSINYYDSIKTEGNTSTYWKDGKVMMIKGHGWQTQKDSLIALQDSLITDLENERDTLYLTDNQAIDSLSQSITDLHGLLQDQALRAAEAEGRLEREKKKRFSVGIQTGAGFKGMDIQVGIQYSLFRF